MAGGAPWAMISSVRRPGEKCAAGVGIGAEEVTLDRVHHLRGHLRAGGAIEKGGPVWPLTWVFKEGNWERTQAISKAGVARHVQTGCGHNSFSSGESKITI